MKRNIPLLLLLLLLLFALAELGISIASLVFISSSKNEATTFATLSVGNCHALDVYALRQVTLFYAMIRLWCILVM